MIYCVTKIYIIVVPNYVFVSSVKIIKQIHGLCAYVPMFTRRLVPYRKYVFTVWTWHFEVQLTRPHEHMSCSSHSKSVMFRMCLWYITLIICIVASKKAFPKYICNPIFHCMVLIIQWTHILFSCWKIKSSQIHRLEISKRLNYEY